MKYLIILLLFSCSEDMEPLTGCRTARDKESGEVVYLRCETREQFNPTNIRAFQWDTTDSLYTSYQWVKCENCK